MTSSVRNVLAATLFFACRTPAGAHEKWFYDAGGHPLRWDLFFRPVPLAFVAAVLAATALAALLWRARGYRDFIPSPEVLGTTPAGRRAIYGLLPLIVGVHFAVPLLIGGMQTTLFSPNVHLHGVAAYALSVAEVFIALALFYGGLTRLAALGLGATWIAGLFIAGPETMLENAHMLGAAVFFFLAGRGPVAIDRLMFPRLEPPPALVRHAVVPLRIGLGLSIATVAFTEKFANLPLAADFLRVYPLNFTKMLGFGLPTDVFILCAASVELLVGLWIMLGIFPREIIIVAWLPFNLTLAIFHVPELVGHLPIYGVLALLLIWIPGERNLDEWVAGVCGPLRPPHGEPGPSPAACISGK